MKYKVFSRPTLPAGRDSPIMDNRDVEAWLNEMDEEGWEFVGYGQTPWADMDNQHWWIFKAKVG